MDAKTITTLEEVHKGNEEALSRLLEEVEPIIYRAIINRIRNEQDAKDLTQDALIQVIRNIHGFDGTRAKLSTWVTHIAKNICISFYRKRTNKMNFVDCEEVQISSSERIDTNLEHEEFESHLEQALSSLPSYHREAFIMRHHQEKSYNEISEKMQLPLSTVKSHIHRARKSLQLMLNDYVMTA